MDYKCRYCGRKLEPGSYTGKDRIAYFWRCPTCRCIFLSEISKRIAQVKNETVTEKVRRTRLEEGV